MNRRTLLAGGIVAATLLCACALVSWWALTAIRVDAESRVRESLAARAEQAATVAATKFAEWFGARRAETDVWRIDAKGEFVTPPEPVPLASGDIPMTVPAELVFLLAEGERREFARDSEGATRFYNEAAKEVAPPSVRLIALSRLAALAGRRGDAEVARRLFTEVATLAGNTELFFVAAVEGGDVDRTALVDAAVRHLGASPRGIVRGYVRLLGLFDEPRVRDRLRELRLMDRIRSLAIPLSAEVRYLGAEVNGFQIGEEIVVARPGDLREVLGPAVRLPGDGPPVPGLFAEAAGPAPLGAFRFVVRGDPTDIDATVRRQATLLIGAVSLAAVIGLAGLAFLLAGVRRQAELARLKSEFVANVSHDLRAPLALIRLYAETLRSGRTPSGEEDDYAAIVEREAIRLSRLVDRVLDFARIERGTKEYRRRPGDLSLAVRSAGEEAKERYPDLALDVETGAGSIPASFDAEALCAAIGNLLDNAAVHGGGRAVLRLSANGGGAARISVLDEGPGVPASEAESIFDRFHRGARATKEAVRGSGLGLTLVRHTAEGHGGRAGVRSRAPRGSEFYIEIPTGGGP